MYGYTGKILNIDLGSGRIEIDEFDADYARMFLGGNGFAADYLFRRVDGNTGPLSEENSIIFTTGPLNGTRSWGTGRGHAAALSPLTGLFADSNYGGDFANGVKRSGFDAIAVTGRSEKPVYISISEGKAEIKSADHLRGKTTEESIEMIKSAEGPGSECTVIGPAGENLVRFANIICSGRRLSAAGRCGLGAVLGSKNCKGISVNGNWKNRVFSSKDLDSILKEQLPLLKENTGILTEFGTPFNISKINDYGKLSTRNNITEIFSEAHRISGDILKDRYITGNTACNRCPVACGKKVSVSAGRYAGQTVKMPEYETLYSFGSMLENGDILSIINGNNACDSLGIDTISMGVTLAFAAECGEKGLFLSGSGETVKFGSGTDIAELVEKTAYRRGIGSILAEGSEAMAAEMGGDAYKYLYTVKGLEVAGHSARGIRHMGLSYATSTRGGSHHDARPKYYEPEREPDHGEIPHYCINSQHFTAVGDSLVMCRFVMERGFGTELNEPLRRLINAVTGFTLTLDDLVKTGERIYNLERLINCGRGADITTDSLPYRVTEEPIPEGPSAGMACGSDHLSEMLREYYKLRGWDSRGIPSEEKIRELGIGRRGVHAGKK